MKRLIIFVLMLLPLAASASVDRDVELIRQRFAAQALKADDPVDVRLVRERMASLTDDGFWPDINYEDTRNVGFRHVEHLRYMQEMARAYKVPGSPLKGNRELRNKLFRAIDFWTANDFICDNWWHNQVGTPTAMIALLYIMDRDLGKERSDQMVRIALRANMDASGARPGGDRCKVASLYTQIVLWQRDIPEVKKMLEFLSGQMRFYTEEEFRTLYDSNPNFMGNGGRGLQPDFSFHHRADRVDNTVSYGSSHASAFADWAIKVYDTAYRFPEESIRLLADYYLDGMCKHMTFACQIDPGIMNRDIARKKYGHQTADNFIPESVMKMTDYRRDELQKVINSRRGDRSARVSFAKMFFNTEYFTFQRPGWFASVRMYSTRNRSIEEPYNGEGLTNHYRADGANYLTVTGDEYLNIYPTFDFRKVPGATVMQEDGMPDETMVQQRGLTDFVGGVDDGLYGAAAFDFISPIDAVSAKKAWFFFDDAYVCLGADVAHKGKQEVATTLNQVFLKGDVTVCAEGVEGVLPKGERQLKGASWVNHAGTGYIFPQKARIGVRNEAVEGSWTRLNRQTGIDRSSITNDIFALWINHGRNPYGDSYAYIVLPGADAARTAAFAADNDLRILANSAEIQAVADMKAGVGYAVFHAGGTLRVGEDVSISSETPAMLLVRFDDSGITGLVASDPSRKSTRLHLSINAGGKVQSYDVNLPGGEYGGSSVRIQ